MLIFSFCPENKWRQPNPKYKRIFLINNNNFQLQFHGIHDLMSIGTPTLSIHPKGCTKVRDGKSQCVDVNIIDPKWKNVIDYTHICKPKIVEMSKCLKCKHGLAQSVMKCKGYMRFTPL